MGEQMNVGEALAVGYEIVALDGRPVTGYAIRGTHGVVLIEVEGKRQSEAVALAYKPEDVGLTLVLHVRYEPEIVDSLLLADVAPLPKDAVLRDFIKHRTRQREREIRRKMLSTDEQVFVPDLLSGMPTSIAASTMDARLFKGMLKPDVSLDVLRGIAQEGALNKKGD